MFAGAGSGYCLRECSSLPVPKLALERLLPGASHQDDTPATELQLGLSNACRRWHRVLLKPLLLEVVLAAAAWIFCSPGSFTKMSPRTVACYRHCNLERLLPVSSHKGFAPALEWAFCRLLKAMSTDPGHGTS